MDPTARRTLLERWKPRAGGRTQLLLAGIMWTVVGALLLGFGTSWTLDALGQGAGALALLAAALAGLVKGRYVLDRTAGRIAERIVRRGDGRCVGGFLSWQSWLLVALMSGAGRLVRGGLLPHAVAGPLYTAVGAGLLFSSRIAWRRWRAAGEP